jgi:hypothetical protein
MSQISQVLNVKALSSARQSGSMRRLGFWSAILTAIIAAAALGVAVTTAPARSGSNCMFATCITYPYTDAVEFVSNDYFWMVPAFLMGPLFVILVVCIRHQAAQARQGFGQIALAFAVISAAALTINYYIQLSVVQPSLLKGEFDGLALFSQYNPHGIFIALEDLGYLMMGAAFLFTAHLFAQRERLEWFIRWILIGSSILALGSFLLLSLLYGSDIGYNYEVVAILIDWTTLIISGVLLSVFFIRATGPTREIE